MLWRKNKAKLQRFCLHGAHSLGGRPPGIKNADTKGTWIKRNSHCSQRVTGDYLAQEVMDGILRGYLSEPEDKLVLTEQEEVARASQEGRGT